MIIWTSSISVLLFRYIFKDYSADLRFIILGSLYPLLFDSISYNFGISNKAQFLGHSLLFNVSLFFLIMIITKRGSIVRRNSLLFSIGSFLYLVLSFTWSNQSVFLYPFFENEQNPIVFSSQIKIVLNLIGTLYLIIKLKTIENLKLFVKNGKLL
tara:strand:- start:83799 stop:84263 length:465 start_codon:yes stop_codon:yes gene_type:complete